MKDREDRTNKFFERMGDEWKQWLESPLSQTEEDAADKILQNIGRQRGKDRLKGFYLPAAVTTALILFLVMFPWQQKQQTIQPGMSNTPTHSSETQFSSEMVVLWLTPETPLYMPLQSNDDLKGEQ